MDENMLNESFPFNSYRPNQKEVIQNMISTFQSKKNFILESPTGSGKSVIGYTISKYLLTDFINKKLVDKDEEEDKLFCIVCTSSKALQKQYINSFAEIDKNVSYLWSAQNYECIYHPPQPDGDEIYYGHSLCPGFDCPVYNSCPYVKQKKKFMAAQLGITNYHYFLNNQKLKPRIVIFDEVHNLEKILCDNASIIFNNLSIKNLFNTILQHSDKADIDKSEDIMKLASTAIQDALKKENIDIDKIKTFSKSFLEESSEVIDDLKEELIDLNKDKKITRKKRKLAKSYNILNRLRCKLSDFVDSKVTWVSSRKDIQKEFFEIKPVQVFEFFNLISKRSEFRMFMSATICGPDQFAKDIGLESEFDYQEVPSTFPVDNRLVGFKPVGKLNYKNKQQILPRFVEAVDNLLECHKKDNGIIHTVSYDNANYFKLKCKNKDRLYIPSKEDMLDLENVIKEKSKKKPIVLCSPVLLEGIDLIDNLSRFQIFIKVPYAFLGDKWVKTKLNEDPKWYARDAIVKLIQGAGRSIRSDKDYAFTYILDENFKNLVVNNRELIPKWFMESIRVIKI
ncbi:MAG: DEAD/DEAH box helicase family protein [Melioribacteraceae bacterium]|nr:DEAD/DEAH box helicase family protein [Melioribacteraceae bacterium]